MFRANNTHNLKGRSVDGIRSPTVTSKTERTTHYRAVIVRCAGEAFGKPVLSPAHHPPFDPFGLVQIPNVLPERCRPLRPGGRRRCRHQFTRYDRDRRTLLPRWKRRVTAAAALRHQCCHYNHRRHPFGLVRISNVPQEGCRPLRSGGRRWCRHQFSRYDRVTVRFYPDGNVSLLPPPPLYVTTAATTTTTVIVVLFTPSSLLPPLVYVLRLCVPYTEMVN